MSTRCNIHFNHGGEVCANIYRHCDGYPDGVLPDLKEFFAEIEKQCPGDTRFSDPHYLAARFVVWQARQNVTNSNKWKLTGEKPDDYLAFISLGIAGQDAGDGEYIYTVDCAKHDKKTKRPTVSHKAV